MDVTGYLKDRMKNASCDQAMKKNMYMLTVVCAVLLAVLLIKGGTSEGKYIYNSEGELIGIYREDRTRAESYSVSLEVEKDPGSRRDLTLVPGTRVQSDTSADSDEDEKSLMRDAEIGGIVSNIEGSDQNRIDLPKELSDGTGLIWSKNEDSGNEWIYVILMYFMLMAVLVFGNTDKEMENRAAARKIIVRCIPRFTNQLLLLMNAGLILGDAFDRICSCYELIPDSKRNLFEREMIDLAESNRTNQKKISSLVLELAGKYNVKELMRIATFMNENERRGSDIIDSLGRESRYLWDDRKITAKEKGKMIETKMAYPLGLLLILLIVITMAPAMLAM